MKKLILILLAVLLGGSYVVAAAVENNYFFPMIYDSSAEPTPTPTATHTPKPTKTPTPMATSIPGELWTWVGSSRNESGNTVIYAVIPGYCCELIGQKSGKTIYVQAVCPANPTCQIFPAPSEIPPPFMWGDVEKLIYPASSKQTCSIQWPFNCKDTQ